MSTSMMIRCDSCQFSWNRQGTTSVYEQQTIESRPCPRCAACTLTCKAKELPRRQVLKFRKRVKQAERVSMVG